MTINVKAPTKHENNSSGATNAASLSDVTLKIVCSYLKIDRREAREKLRHAAKDAKKYPEIHKARKQGREWKWPANSAALKEVQLVLASATNTNVKNTPTTLSKLER